MRRWYSVRFRRARWGTRRWKRLVRVYIECFSSTSRVRALIHTLSHTEITFCLGILMLRRLTPFPHLRLGNTIFWLR